MGKTAPQPQQPEQGLASHQDNICNQSYEQAANRQVVTTMAVPSNNSSTIYNVNQALKAGITQIVCGIALLGLQTTALVVNAHAAWGLTGYWCSVFFLVAGAFGVHSAKTKSRYSIITTLIMSILAAIFAFGVFVQAIVGVAMEDTDICDDDFFDDDLFNNGIFDDIFDDDDDDCPLAGRYTVNVLMLVLSVVEGLAAIIAAVTSGTSTRKTPPMQMIVPAHNAGFQGYNPSSQLPSVSYNNSGGNVIVQMPREQYNGPSYPPAMLGGPPLPARPMPGGPGVMMTGGPMPGGPMPGGPMTGGPMPGGPMPGGPMPGGPMTGGPMTGGPMPGGPMTGGPMPGGPMAGGPMTGGPMAGGPEFMSSGYMGGMQPPPYDAAMAAAAGQIHVQSMLQDADESSLPPKQTDTYRDTQ